jgi:hypothetical protein
MNVFFYSECLFSTRNVSNQDYKQNPDPEPAFGGKEQSFFSQDKGQFSEAQ